MWWRKKKKEPISHPIGDTLTDKMLGSIFSLQKKWTLFLGHRTAHWSARAKRLFLAGVILSFGGHATFILIGTITGSADPSAPRWDRMKLPRMPPSKDTYSAPPLNAEDTLQILGFRRLLDSLQATPEGRRQVDDFLRARPGFLDSLHQAEQLLNRSFPF